MPLILVVVSQNRFYHMRSHLLAAIASQYTFAAAFPLALRGQVNTETLRLHRFDWRVKHVNIVAARDNHLSKDRVSIQPMISTTMLENLTRPKAHIRLNMHLHIGSIFKICHFSKSYTSKISTFYTGNHANKKTSKLLKGTLFPVMHHTYIVQSLNLLVFISVDG